MNMAAIAAAAAAAAGDEPSLPPSLEGPPQETPPSQPPPTLQDQPPATGAEQQQQQPPDSPPSGLVATLFVSGLPSDMKQRELHTLFRPYKGYEGSTMKYMGDFSAKVVAFVSFSTQEQALKAKEDLNGLQYDPENPHTVLRIELAKANTRSKRPHEPTAEYEKKQPRYDSSSMPPMAYGAPPSTQGYPYADPYAAASAMPPAGMPPMMPSAGGQRPPPTPCNTIFVSNLANGVTEEHLKSLFSNLGQKRVRLLPKGTSLVAFIEFETVEQAQYAISATSGYDFMGNPLRVEYARAPMGQPTRRR